MTAADRAAESRRRQGLPPKITDPTTVARVVALLAEGTAPSTVKPSLSLGRQGGEAA